MAQVTGKKYQHSDEVSDIIVSKTKKMSGRKRMVLVSKGKEPPVWTIGFESWDFKGIVYKDPWQFKHWLFFREDYRTPVYHRPMALYSDGTPRQMSFKEKIQVGIMNEIELTRQLREKLGECVHVYTLPWSGAHTEGTDLIITEHEETDFTEPMKAVRRSLFAISLVGYRHGELEITTHINEWYYRCLRDGTTPVVAWATDRYTKDEKHWFIILNIDNLHKVFFSHDRPIKHMIGAGKTISHRIDMDSFVLEVCKVLKSSPQ